MDALDGKIEPFSSCGRRVASTLTNELVDFLVNRSGSALPEKDGTPKIVEPAKGVAQSTPASADSETESESETAARAVNA